MATSRSKESSGDDAIALGGVALIGSILANLKQAGDNKGLRSTIGALQRLVADWQSAYTELDAQLRLALRSNEELNRLTAALRQERDQLRERLYGAEQRSLELEATVARLQGELKAAKERTAAMEAAATSERDGAAPAGEGSASSARRGKARPAKGGA
jgi:chromosome segregation ATPase